jgi:hypothetical protein
MLLLVRAFFPPSAGETSEKEQEERPSSNLLPQAGEGKKLKSAPMGEGRDPEMRDVKLFPMLYARTGDHP